MLGEAMKVKRLRKVYCLRIRPDDQSEWSKEAVYYSKKRRDQAERVCRIIAGYRTHSFDRHER